MCTGQELDVTAQSKRKMSEAIANSVLTDNNRLLLYLSCIPDRFESILESLRASCNGALRSFDRAKDSSLVSGLQDARAATVEQ